MNDRTWEIKEISQEEIRQHIEDYKYDGKPSEIGKYYGQTYFDEQIIYIDKDLHIEQKRQTLLHELMHCYIGCYLYEFKSFDEENVCNISANSHDIIHKIVEDYFK
jgi:Zn-dependent peptidase ImmA (M78 family)